MGDQEASTGGTRVHDGIERLKRHPVLSIALFASLLLGTGAVLWNAVRGGGEFIAGVVNPHQEEYAAIAALDLDVRFDFFEEHFGTFRAMEEACDPEVQECPDTGGEPLRLYLHETDVAIVRALFEGETLRAYLVTTTSEEFRPPATWLGYDLGELGRTDAATMLAVPGQDLPVETAAHWTPQSVSYVDVVAPGGPGSYRGLVLAWTPEGAQTEFAAEHAVDLAQADAQGGDVQPHIDRLHAGTQPNTFGQFRDDGAVGMWLRDPEVVQGLLFANTEF